MGRVSFHCALCFIPLLVCFPLAVFGLPLGLTTWLMARRDLAKMRAGEMERQGEKETLQAERDGLFGLIYCLGVWLFWGLMVMVISRNPAGAMALFAGARRLFR
jgi:hypothetical protein